MKQIIIRTLFVLLGLFSLGMLAYKNMKDHDEFMESCTQEHERYQCQMFWSTGEVPR